MITDDQDYGNVVADERTSVEGMPFVRVAYPLLYDSSISCQSKIIYLILMGQRTNPVRCSWGTLAKCLGASARTIRVALAALRERGLIEIEPDGACRVIHPSRVYGDGACFEIDGLLKTAEEREGVGHDA